MRLDIREGDRPAVAIHSAFDEKEQIKALPVRRWLAGEKVWVAPLSHLLEIDQRFPLANRTPAFTRCRLDLIQRADLVRAVQANHLPFAWHTSMPAPVFHTAPFLHQESGAAFLLARPTALLLDDMGLGKTKQALDAITFRAGIGEITRCLVICPNSVKYVWRAEIERHCQPGDFDTILLGGGREERDRDLHRFMHATDPTIAIVNYEAARLHGPQLLSAVRGQALICDEAHALKNRKTQISKLVASLRPRVLYLLTGTPVANKPDDFWHLVDLVEPGLLGSYWQFTERYCVQNHFGGVVAYRHLDELHERTQRCWLRRLKADCLDLPDKIHSVLPVDLSAEERAAYDAMTDTLRASIADKDDRWVTTHANSILTQFLRLAEIADGMVRQGEDVAIVDTPAKTQALDDIVAGLDGGKLVIWTRFLPLADFLADRYGALLFTGKIHPAERANRAKVFEECDYPNIFVATIQSAGQGLNELKVAQTEVFYDHWWSPAVNHQAEDRLHRIGQTGTVNVIHLLARDTIDERIHRLLARKGEWANSILGDPESPEAPITTKSELLNLLT